jgi:hypothetical protein
MKRHKLTAEDQSVIDFRRWLGLSTCIYDGKIRQVLRSTQTTEEAQEKLLEILTRPSIAEREMVHG